MTMKLDDPIVAAVSDVGETRWGFHQFPNLSRLPDGRIVLTWANAADASETHGDPAPCCVSRDDGRSWEAYEGSLTPVRPHFSVSKVYNDEYLVMPSAPYLNVAEAGVRLPEPRSTANVYGTLHNYLIADLPSEVQDYYCHIPGYRWSSKTGEWRDDIINYDPGQMLAWKREGSDVLPRTFFERHLLRHNGELLYADCRACYAMDDGFIPPKGCTHLMVSTDNGRSFQRRAVVAVDREGRDLYGEPQLAPTTDGRLLCAIRKTDQEQKPMVLCWSSDNGHTWTAPQEAAPFGVWPCIQLLDCGALALSYGRPGVRLCIDKTGTGEHWSDPMALIEGSHEAITEHSCGYTCILPLDASSFLIAYSDFKHHDDDGNQRKAILVRRVALAV